MKVPSSSRNRSGDAWASCSSSRRAGSILGVTVIVVSFFESVFADHSKDHPMAVTYIGSDTLTGIRTPLCRTSLGTSVDRHDEDLLASPRIGRDWSVSTGAGRGVRRPRVRRDPPSRAVVN